MTTAVHYFSELFAQLGLPNDDDAIAQFLTLHSSMADGFRLPDAPYWTPAQSAFLREALLQDSDWSGVVDQLSKALRAPPAATAQQSLGLPDHRDDAKVKEDPAQSEELERQQDA